MKIVTADQMRQIDQECSQIGLPTDVLMENSGIAVAKEVKQILANIDKQHILILTGPGNNGGDGLVAASYLHNWGAKITLYLFSQRPADDKNLKQLQEKSVMTVNVAQDETLEKFDEILSSVNAVIDAIFGTGKNRPLHSIIPKALDKVNRAKEKRTALKVIAVDLPSGLNTDTGAVDPACLNADNTITLGFPKWGLFISPGSERAGKITIAEIGIPAYLAEQIPDEIITNDWARSVVPKRPLTANKGNFGKVLTITGSTNYIGAAYLAASGAMRVGAGLVTLATPASLQPIIASKLTEATYLPLPESQPGTISGEAAKLIHKQLDQYNVMLLGCGLGQSQSTARFIKSTLFNLPMKTPLVLDADALNILSKIKNWWQDLATEVILTPHPGEMARLTGVLIDAVQSDRVNLAKKLAREWHKTIVLKGAYSIVATPHGHTKVSLLANPGLASAGTGDVLAGAIAGLVAQGLTLLDAAALGVYLHGKAGELVKEKIGDAGMIATDLLSALPLVIKKLKE
ncbi:NAD(P)H-hydrate dehydratase [Chloroflexota bacterium]